MNVIRPIQYLRGIAAVMVVAHHAANQLDNVQTQAQFSFGPSGVDLFFVISGFIMVVTARDVSAAEFIRRRIVRVVPLYWLLTLTMICVALLAPSLFKTLRFSTATVVESLLFIPHHSLSFPGVAWPVLVPGWTLNFEMFFYGVFALSLLLARNYRFAGLAATLGALIVVGLVFGPFDSPVWQTYTSPLLLEFVGGALIGRLWLTNRLEMPVAASEVAMLIGAALLVQRYGPPLQQFNPMLGAALVVSGALNLRFAEWRNRFLQSLGDASYSIYLTHIFTLGVLRVLWVRLVPASTASAWAFVAIGLIASAAVGWLSYRWLEQPMLRWFNSRGRNTVRAA